MELGHPSGVQVPEELGPLRTRDRLQIMELATFRIDGYQLPNLRKVTFNYLEIAPSSDTALDYRVPNEALQALEATGVTVSIVGIPLPP